jgi:phage shock protein A
MSIFSRLGTLLKSNINDLISRAEDPEKILNQLIQDMKEQLLEAKKQVASAIADERKLFKQLENERHLANQWEKKAMMAVKAGRDDLAIEALQRKEQHEALSAEYQGQWEAQKAATDSLRSALRQLNNKIEEAKRKKDLLIARQRRAEAQARIQQTMAGFGDTSAFESFERMAEKVDKMEAQAEANAELAKDMSGSDLDSKFASLELETGANDALQALKSRMGVAAPAAAEVNQSAEATAEEAEEVEEFDFEQLERELAATRATLAKA